MSEDAAAPAVVEQASAPTNDVTTKSSIENGTTNGNGHLAEEPVAASEIAKPSDTANGDTENAEPAVESTLAESGDKTKAEQPEAVAGSGKQDRRKSGVGKKLSKKKSMPVLQLSCEPGQYYWARMKGHAAWPAIIAAEDMLPERLLATRPVSAARPDGSLREDFRADGKNAKERTYAVMYLGTNEFSWINNASLTPLHPEECKEAPKTKAKYLHEAYELAVEHPDLEHFRDLLATAQAEEKKIEEEIQRIQAEAQAKADERAAAAKQPKKKQPRKSKGAADEDVEMEDADVPKSSKKRKKVEESDGEGVKPKKTPKVMKLNGPKTPAEAETPTGKKDTTKTKKKVVSKAQPEEPEAKVNDEERTEKSILYFRHRLQKGFISRDDPPRESEMPGMAEYFAQLEHHEDLPPSIIRNTRIHKVLKAIIKLDFIPREEEYNFKKRSVALLEIWNKRMEAEGESMGSRNTTGTDKQSKANGVAKAEAKPVESTKKTAKDDSAKATEVANGTDGVESTSDSQPKPVEGESGKSSKAEADAGTEESHTVNGQTGDVKDTEAASAV